MPKYRVEYKTDEQEIVYTQEHWDLIEAKMLKALEVTKPLFDNGIPYCVYGSIARGDVKPSSDFDILIKGNLTSFQVSLALETSGAHIIDKEIIQATPGDAVKGYFYLPDDVSITLFLTSARDISYEFYDFAGNVDHDEIINRTRKPGINKNLIVIIPTEKGHREVSVLGNEGYAGEVLGISQQIIESRKRVLTRRDKIGRTGVFLKEFVDSDETMEGALKRIADKNPAVRRRLRR